MSLARLVITAVDVEGRSQERGRPRLRGLPVLGAAAGAPLRGRGRGGVRAAVAAAALQPASGRPGGRGPDRPAPQGADRRRAWTPARRRSPRTWPIGRGLDPVPAVSTIWRILARRGFVTPQPQKRPRSSWQRFCADQPNERWQADITHWRLADGTEVEILNILDDHSRLCIAADARRDHHRPRRGGTPSPPRSPAGASRPACSPTTARSSPAKQRGDGRVALEVQLGLRGIRLDHSRPYHPQTCGKVERFHQTQKKWLAAQPRAATLAGLQRQLDRFPRYYNTVRPHRALGPAHPRPGLRRPTQSRPHRPGHRPPTTESAHDSIDTGGTVTLRHNSRLHHIGLGTRLAGTPVTLLIDDLHIRVIHRHTGELIRELILDPTRDYQPRGLPPGPPKTDRSHTPAASRSRPHRATAAGVKAGRRPPAGPRP